MDFILDCEFEKDGNSWDLNCNLKPESQISIEKFGKRSLGYISISYDLKIIDHLSKKFKKITTHNTVILNMVFREPNSELVGIGMAMICSLLSNLHDLENVQFIYLEAISDKLLKIYKKFNFFSIDENNSHKMIGNIEDIAMSCIKINSRKIPVLITHIP